MAPVSKLERAETILKELNRDTVSFEQLAGLLRALAENIAAVKSDFLARVDEKTLEYLRRYNGITQLFDETTAQMDAALTKKADARETREQLERLRRDMQRLAQDVRDDIPEEPDLGPIELELSRLKAAMPRQVDDRAIWAAVQDVSDTLEDFRKDLTQLKDARSPGFRMFTPRGFQLYVNGRKIGQVNEVNFPGATYSKTNGRHDVTITGTGGLSVLTATGSVDGSNTTFTFASAPTLVVVNGATYRDGHGCSISGTTVTLDYPVGTGGDIYALG